MQPSDERELQTEKVNGLSHTHGTELKWLRGHLQKGVDTGVPQCTSSLLWSESVQRLVTPPHPDLGPLPLPQLAHPSNASDVWDYPYPNPPLY
ncbi:hypothetical protein P7K49_019560 [Saguinus oedipus]|uniref:Uncharacterized protein n=1 Tax=Saguinus oedipus TaxID=9490 RepID=A0ABQ9UXU8_SAGOE|nr:hypothetical protein P7K49_019560 [Saguinus oedipus]